MARYKLRSPEQPLWLQGLLGLFEFCSSLKLAVVLIFSSAVVLAVATFVESWYGLPAVHFGIYGTWWFTLLNALLALCIFCAAAIRYPWKRHQTGFVITHIGLLTLLFGCLLSRTGGIDAQMPIFEGGMSSRAYEDNQHFLLEVSDAPLTGADFSPGAGELLRPIEFEAGPFNWADYHDKLPYLPWRLAHRDRGLLHDDGGIRLEVLDYYSNSEEIDAPYLRLWLSMPRMSRMGADGREAEAPEQWVPVELHVSATRLGSSEHRFGIGQRQKRGGGTFIFTLAASPADVDAFLHSRPQGSLGERGQVVLRAAGKDFHIQLDDKKPGERFKLEGTPFEAEIVRHVPDADVNPRAPSGKFEIVDFQKGDAPHKTGLGPAVELRIYEGDAAPQRMLLFSDIPEWNIQDYGHDVFASYWFDHGEKTSAELLQGEGGARIDILQAPVGPDGQAQLYYRYWNRKEVVFARELPADETPVDAFRMPIGQLKMYVDRFIPNERPGSKVVPRPFDKDTLIVSAVRAARVRLTVDGHSEEFWLLGTPADPRERALLPSERHVVVSPRRSVAISMPLDAIDVGFQVALNDFEMKLDPGTSQPSHYSSYVDFIDPLRGRRMHSNVWITMNAPVDFSDPRTGRSYRLFQESFMGPWVPTDQEFKRQVEGASDKDELYASVLTVNRDPGRLVKYIGCLFVVVGIATMFYMRAYFFKPAAKKEAQPAAKPRRQPARQPVAI